MQREASTTDDHNMSVMLWRIPLLQGLHVLLRSPLSALG